MPLANATAPKVRVGALPRNIRETNIEAPFSGTLPTEIGLLRLHSFETKSRGLSGTLPSQIGLITSLRSLRVASTRASPGMLSGTLPVTLSNLTRLQRFQVNHDHSPGLSSLATFFSYLSLRHASELPHRMVVVCLWSSSRR